MPRSLKKEIYSQWLKIPEKRIKNPLFSDAGQLASVLEASVRNATGANREFVHSVQILFRRSLASEGKKKKRTIESPWVG